MIREAQHNSGFTLVEVVIGVALAVAVIGLVLSSFLGISTSSSSAVAYGDMHSNIRHALDIMNRDILASREIVSYTEGQSITFTVVLAAGSQTIQYYVSNEDLHRVRPGGDVVLASGIAGISFRFYRKSGGSTSDITEAYAVEVILTASSQATRDTYFDVLRTRGVMRNRGT